jgi:hypothetical protein
MTIVQISAKYGHSRRTIGLPVKPSPVLPTCVDVAQRRLDYTQEAVRLSSEFHANLFAEDLEDEFGDVDNELEGLAIVEPRGTMGLFAFCSGYDVL